VGVLLLLFITSMAFSATLGVTIERLAYRPLRHAGRLSPLLSALGVSIFLQNATMVVVGPQPHFLQDSQHEILPTVAVPFFGLVLTNKQVITLVVATVLMVGLHWLVNYTLFGMAVRAVAEDKDAASLMGIDVDRIISMVFVIGPALGAAAGILFALQFNVALWNMGFIAGLKAFTAAVLGGIGNIPGAMLGGLLLGVLETVGAGYLPIITNGAIGPEYKDIFAFLILILVLVFRPTGLLGERVAR
jgi:branched-chain amino acid transport system permease protein